MLIRKYIYIRISPCYYPYGSHVNMRTFFFVTITEFRLALPLCSRFNEQASTPRNFTVELTEKDQFL